VLAGESTLSISSHGCMAVMTHAVTVSSILTAEQIKTSERRRVSG